MHKEEAAHEDSIWSCTWGRTRIDKPKKTTGGDEDEHMEDSTEEGKDASDPEYKDFIVTGGLDDFVKIWDVDDEKLRLRYSMAGHSLGVVSVTVSPDGKSIC